MHRRVEIRLAYPGQPAHPGHVLSGTELVYKTSRSDPHSEFYYVC